MILKVLAALSAVVVAILVYAATRPDSIHIQRSIVINAPVEKVFPFVNDFHRWTVWAPQDKEDPTMRRTFSGSDTGFGAISSWDSSGSAGKGVMRITESDPLKRVVVQADWQKPFSTRNTNLFTFGSVGRATQLTWTFEGRNLYPMKVMSAFVSMDKMMGGHFATGLANLKAAAEQ